MKKIFLSILVLTTGLWAQSALAYIDPASGSAIMSAIIGFFVAVGLAIKTYWYKLKSLFVGEKKEEAVELTQEQNRENGMEEK